MTDNDVARPGESRLIDAVAPASETRAAASGAATAAKRTEATLDLPGVIMEAKSIRALLVGFETHADEQVVAYAKPIRGRLTKLIEYMEQYRA